MLFKKRAELILDLLEQEQTIAIQKMVAELGVSESTIRRDLITLEESGKLRRIHGGATSVHDLGTEQRMAQKEKINLEAKQSVAQFAAAQIHPDSQIFVDAGTASLELVRCLPNDKNLKIVTNGVDHALLAVKRGIEVELLGGIVNPSTHAIANITAYKQLERMNFNFAFIGMNGIHEDKGLTTTNIEEALLKELAMNQSQNSRILVDDSKVNEVYAYQVNSPSQTIVLLNEKAESKFKNELDKIREHYDLMIIKD